MSLPGLGLEEPVEVQKVETTQHELTKESEWRFEVGASKYVHLKVRFPLSSMILTDVL